MRPANIIVGASLRVTTDFRSKDQRDAGANLETKVAKQRAWYADRQARDAGKVLYFGGQQRGSAAK